MRCFAATVLIAMMPVSTGFATTVVPLSFDKLVSESSAIVYGRVSDVRSQWTADRRFIESVVSIDVIKGMKGGTGDTIAFTVPGGQVGRYRNVIPGAPTFATGDLAVFFLTAQGPRLPVTTGLTQGVYRVQHDAASGVMLVMPPIVDSGARVVRGDVRRKPVSLTAFEGSVRAVARPSDPSTGSGSSRAGSRDDTLKLVPSVVEGR